MLARKIVFAAALLSALFAVAFRTHSLPVPVGEDASVREAAQVQGPASDISAILDDFYHHPDRILISAHRADHKLYPENSIQAIKQAIRAGIDIVELDIRETKDSVLVIMHDKNIDRTTTGKGPVSSYTYKELQQFFLLQNGKPSREKIPTFQQVLETTRGHIMIDIDFKEDSMRPARNTFRLLKKMDMEKQVLFFVYDYKDVPGFRRLDNDVPVMPRAYNGKDVHAILSMGGFPVIHVDESYYSDSLMSSIRKAGLRVWINALGKYDDMEEKRAGSGFDALSVMRQANVIQTNYPEELLSYLRAKGLHR